VINFIFGWLLYLFAVLNSVLLLDKVDHISAVAVNFCFLW